MNLSELKGYELQLFCDRDGALKGRGGNFRHDLKTRHEANTKLMGLGFDFEKAGQNRVRPDKPEKKQVKIGLKTG